MLQKKRVKTKIEKQIAATKSDVKTNKSITATAEKKNLGAEKVASKQ